LRCAVRNRPGDAAGRKVSGSEISWTIPKGPAGVSSSPEGADSRVEETAISTESAVPAKAAVPLGQCHVRAAHNDWHNQCNAQESNSSGHGLAAPFLVANRVLLPI